MHGHLCRRPVPIAPCWVCRTCPTSWFSFALELPRLRKQITHTHTESCISFFLLRWMSVLNLERYCPVLCGLYSVPRSASIEKRKGDLLGKKRARIQTTPI